MNREGKYDLFAEEFLNDAEFMAKPEVKKLIDFRSKLIELSKVNYENGFYKQRFESLALDEFNEKMYPAGVGLASATIIGIIAGSALIAMGSSIFTVPLSFLAEKGIKKLAGGTKEEIDNYKQQCRINYTEINSKLIDVNRELMQMYKKFKNETDQANKVTQTSELDDYLNNYIANMFKNKSQDSNEGRSR